MADESRFTTEPEVNPNEPVQYLTVNCAICESRGFGKQRIEKVAIYANGSGRTVQYYRCKHIDADEARNREIMGMAPDDVYPPQANDPRWKLLLTALGLHRADGMTTRGKMQDMASIVDAIASCDLEIEKGNPAGEITFPAATGEWIAPATENKALSADAQAQAAEIAASRVESLIVDSIEEVAPDIEGE